MSDYVYAYRNETTGEIQIGHAQAPVPRHAVTAGLALCFELEPAPEFSDDQVMAECRGVILFGETLRR